MAAHADEIERRLVALARDLVETLDARYPDGYEIRDFLLLYHLLAVPDPNAEREPWSHAAYAGWDKWITFSTTTGNWWVDEMILAEALERLRGGATAASPSRNASRYDEPLGSFEVRVAAFLQDFLAATSQDYRHGFEIGDVGIVCELAVAPPGGEDLRPWDIGPYAGWTVEVAHATTSRSPWFEAEMIADVLAYVRERRYPLYTEPDEEEDLEGEEPA